MGAKVRLSEQNNKQKRNYFDFWFIFSNESTFDKVKGMIKL